MPITSVTQDAFDNAEALMLEAVRNDYSGIDLRRGTAVRDIMIRPSATLHAYTSANADAAAGYGSLEKMRQAGGTVDVDAVNAILSNFNTTYRDGEYASGYIRLVFSNNSTRLLPAGFGFNTSTDPVLRFNIPEALSFSVSSGASVQYETMTISGTTVYTVAVRVVAEAKGSAYNVPNGTYFEPVNQVIGLVDSLAMSSFSGGDDAETIDEVIARLPTAIASRSLSNATSVKARLTDQFGAVIKEVSLQGMGSATQDRGKLLGISVGGYVDGYIRCFDGPAITVIPKTGVRSGSTYTVTLTQAESAGVYAVRAISDWNSSYAPVDSASTTYAFSTVRALGSTLSGHRILTADQAAFSCFQQLTITVYDANASADKDLKVELFVAPGLLDMQDYVDLPAVRNSGVDLVLKAPPVCRVSLNATVYVPANVTETTADIRTRVVDYINTQSFTSTLSLARIIQYIGYQVDVAPTKITLSGVLEGAGGQAKLISGCSDLDLTREFDAADYLTVDTVVFAADPADITINRVTI